jgi:hypothetical protein
MKVFFVSLFTSLMAGALVWVTIWGIFVAMASPKEAIDDFISPLFCITYVIYILIQAVLTLTNTLQLYHLNSPDRKENQHSPITELLTAEAVLYSVVFFLFCSLFGRDSMPEIMGYIFMFSIPYIISCTISIFITAFIARIEFKAQNGSPVV